VVAALNHSEVAVPEFALPAVGTPEERLAFVLENWVPARVPDIRFLVDQLVGDAAVDADRVGIVGHSFGGWAALATPDQDERIGAVVALAPAGAEPAPPGTIPVTLRFAWSRTVPTLYLVARDDAALPIEGMYQLYERTPGPKRMVILHRADHLHFIDDVERRHESFRTASFAGPVVDIQTRTRPITELCSGAEAHLFVRGLTVAHFDATLRGRSQAEQFLDGDLSGELARREIGATIVGPSPVR
jgi:dienelactone hydrolase